MPAIKESGCQQRGRYHGLRMTAEQFLALPEDQDRYELIDGVAVMSPSPSTRHQRIAGEVYLQLAAHVKAHGLGLALYEIDVLIGQRPDGRDLVYRPEIIFIRADRAAGLKDRVRIIPDVVVEIISPDSRSLDTQTKRNDYEQAAVREYWLIDPERDACTFYRLTGGRFMPVPEQVDFYESAIVSGFRLDLQQVRAAFKPSA